MKTASTLHPLRMRRFEGDDKDPYAVGQKLKSPTVCPGCRAVFEKGRWQWRHSWPKEAERQPCPACRRTKERNPAGWMRLRGSFVEKHRGELVRIARREEKREAALHPLNRIMRIEDGPDEVLITTTDIHLPHAIGEALKRAHEGALQVRYDLHGYGVRVEWTRESP